MPWPTCRPGWRPPPVFVVDTGFVLSVAAIDGMARSSAPVGRGGPPGPRGSERTALPRRDPGKWRPRRPRRALNGTQRWLPTPIELDDDDLERLLLIARQLGGTDDRHHLCDAAGAIIAERADGILATEDLAAADVIRASFGPRTTSITGLLEKLGTDGTWNETEAWRPPSSHSKPSRGPTWRLDGHDGARRVLAEPPPAVVVPSLRQLLRRAPDTKGSQRRKSRYYVL